jgi:hypothetical protein
MYLFNPFNKLSITNTNLYDLYVKLENDTIRVKRIS